MQQEYLSIKKLAIKYDLHPDTIKKKKMIEGVHFIKIGSLVRYNVEEMHKLLTNTNVPQSIDLNNFLINSVK